jgi:hypothetical protein
MGHPHPPKKHVPDPPKNHVPACGRFNVTGLDYEKDLPCGVPPVEMPAGTSSSSPIPPPVGPAEATYYLPVTSLEKCNPTGVFFPSKFSFLPEINVILYFHGFKLGEFENMNQYLNGNDVFGKHQRLSHKGICLRDDINTSGKRVVLIAPTMGEFPGSSDHPKDMGIFADPEGGDQFLAEVLRWIGKYVPQYRSAQKIPKIGKLVLAGHSGAGVILLTQAKSMKTPISEVWGFDSTYGESGFGRNVVSEWLTLARSHRQMKFFFHWATSGPGHNAKKLDELARKEPLRNITVSPVQKTVPVGDRGNNGPHFDTVITNFLTRVQNASCFS